MTTTTDKIRLDLIAAALAACVCAGNALADWGGDDLNVSGVKLRGDGTVDDGARARHGGLAKMERQGRRERAERVEKAERLQKAERPEKPERMQRIERPDKLERVQRPERVERPEHEDRGG